MDEFTNEELEQLMAVFRDQSLQILDEMSQDLLALESKGIDLAILARLRRAAHTIKGDSSCIGLDGVTRIAHWIEDIFDRAVEEQTFDRAVVDLILEGLDYIRDCLSTDQVTDVPPDKLNRFLESIRHSENADKAAPGREEEHQPELEAALADTPDAELMESGVSSDDDAAKGSLNGGGKQRRDYVRVEAARIDALLNLAGEMVIARSVINQISPELEQALEKNELVSKFGSASTQMGKLIAELQKSVLKMRMVTIDQVFKRFGRPMRELAARETSRSILLRVVARLSWTERWWTFCMSLSFICFATRWITAWRRLSREGNSENRFRRRLRCVLITKATRLLSK